jgi:hypothetical protein
LNNEDILSPDIFQDLEGDLVITQASELHLAQRNLKMITDSLSESNIG